MEVECAVMIIRVFKNCECSEFLFWRGFARYTWGGQTAKHQQMIYGRYIGLAATMHSPDELKLCSWEWVSSSFAFPSCLALAFCLGDQPLFIAMKSQLSKFVRDAFWWISWGRSCDRTYLDGYDLWKSRSSTQSVWLRGILGLQDLRTHRTPSDHVSGIVPRH